MEVVTVLKQCRLFESFESNEKLFEDLSEIVQIESFNKNDVIFHEGDVGDKLYIVANGSIEIIKDVNTDNNYLLAILRQEDFFGEMALIDSKPRSATAIVTEKAELLSISKKDFDDFINRSMSPSLSVLISITRVMSERIRHSNEIFRGLLHMSLDEASHRKSEMSFLSMISHELRTPLYLIQGFLSVLQEDEIDDESREEAVHVIFNEGNRLSRMINNLVLFSQMEYSGMSIVRKESDIVKLLRDVVEDHQQDAKEYNIKLLVEATPEHIVFPLDQKRMRQVIANILDNGFKYSKSEGGEIDIRITDKPRYIELSFTDTGIGIAKKDLPNIFERFFQTNLMTRRAATGGGIGLAICKDIVEAHGGTIMAKSEENVGSEFVIRLPKTAG